MTSQSVIPKLEEAYRSQILAHLRERFDYQSIMQVPRIIKVTLNMGVGEAISDKKLLDNAVGDLEKIVGQKPVISYARKSVAAFKVRKGWAIGCKVTLRRTRMYEFLDRLISIAIPRIRDFRGFSPKAFDGRGNYNLGIREQIIFPEIDYDKIDTIRGLDIAISTSAMTDEEGRALLAAFNFPFRQS
uniref:Large ribosomal subunit protein uL5 n=1 Tax=Candidatus Kentrum eta TaxID=2126337 RepID=A0A450V8N2_9GAMM|nr:MAG: large subunit ribosomal protein L5 [Candidatus Kentron sp. H]VFK01130.1 MAG: large subunit ribosomal protein L5 [Candidatus Kentron sp. H]VFK03586.1 MAG: large subunit ribosomal protein L5 [Candidatus Kentron sp. H]